MTTVITQEIKVTEEINGKEILRRIERLGRIAWKSENKNPGFKDYEKTKQFIRTIMSAKHESVIEHVSLSFIIITNRAIANEIVRHRLASYTQLSTRYYNHNKKSNGGEMVCIKPYGLDKHSEGYSIWLKSMRQAEESYKKLRHSKIKPEICRGVLPLDLATEIAMTMNLRNLRHFITLRADKSAHPQIRELAIEMLKILHDKIDIIFDDLYNKFIEQI